MLTPKRFSNLVQQLPRKRNPVAAIDALIKEYKLVVDAARAAGARRLPGNGEGQMREALERTAKNGPNADTAAKVALALFLAAIAAVGAGAKRKKVEADAASELRKLRGARVQAKTTGEALTAVIGALQKGNASLSARLRALIEAHQADKKGAHDATPKAPTAEWGTFRTKRKGRVGAKEVAVLRARGELVPAYTRLLNGALHPAMTKEGK